MNTIYTVKGDFIDLIIVHYKLIDQYSDSNFFNYKGISITKSNENSFLLKYKLIPVNLYKNNIYEGERSKGQSEAYKRSEFYKGTSRLFEME